MKKIEGKTALITGCNRGIGRAIMETFMAEGANIVACTRKFTPELETYYKQSEEKYSVNIRPLVFDLADENSIKAAMKELYSWKIAVDILVNNAGVAHFSPFMLTGIQKVRDTFQINFFAPLVITQYVVKLMMKTKKGSIINMASISGIDANAGNTAYGSSKAAIISWTKTISQEFSKIGIRSNVIAPGFVETDMQSVIDSNYSLEMIKRTAIKRFAKANEIAKVALFLASEESSYITGQVIRVDGGL
jgi:3-oxoacyl-[acyl-carrier protein] reductase